MTENILSQSLRVLFVQKSANVKTGPIPVTYSDEKTCPPSCPHFRGSCYAEGFHTRLAWNRAGRDGLDWAALCKKILALPDGQLWRHNIAGDLPGDGESVDPAALGQLVAANRGKRGFTYSHKRSPVALEWIKAANNLGFTVNLSADDAGEADALIETECGPVVCVVPIDSPERSTTPKGRPIVVCPAQTRNNVTCQSCGLCARPDRGVIVGFRAHGTKAKAADITARRVIPISIHKGVNQ